MGNAPSPEEIAWMKANIDDTRVPDIIACCAVCSAASVVILALRIWSRLQIRRLDISDYMAISSVVVQIALCVVFPYSTRSGVGRHIIVVMDKPSDLRMLPIYTLMNAILYGVATAFVKWSILALYVAIFPQKYFRYWVYFLCAINGFNAIVIVLVSCLQCRPLEALWKPEVAAEPESTCIDYATYSLFNTAFIFAFDVVILLSPLWLVKKLQLSRRKKVLLALNFVLGGGACVVAAIRLPYTTGVAGTFNPSWDVVPAGLLCVVEVTTSLLCASLPIYRPLLKRFAPKFIRSGGYTNYHSGNQVNSAYPGGTGSQVVNTHIAASSHQRRSSRKGGINVTDNIAMMTHANVNGKWVRVNDDDGYNDDGARLVRTPEEDSYNPPSTITMNKTNNHRTFLTE